MGRRRHPAGLVAGDNLLWRLAGWIATYAFVAVGGDLRLDLFDHLSGHGARYFTDQFPGALAGRITTAANAAWSIENSLTWTTIPPAAAVVSSIAVLGIIDWQMTAIALRHRHRCSASSSPGAPRAASICTTATPAAPRR